MRLKNARLVVRVGLDYDLWLDRLLVQAGRPRDQARRPRLCRCLICASQRWKSAASPSDRATVMPMAAAIRIIGSIPRMPRSSPPRFLKHWRGSIRPSRNLRSQPAGISRAPGCQAGRMGGEVERLKGMPIVAYHNSWPYFARRFRLDFVGFIEIKPGVPPSPSHLAASCRHARARRAHRRARAA